MLGNLRDQKINFDFNSKEVESWSELERFMLHQIFILNKNFDKYFKEYNFHKLYKELINFCSLDLSAFYFDIRKDTLYCDGLNSPKRKSTIVFLNILIEILLKWFAPILSFTTEEIYSLLKINTNKSIHLENFSRIPSATSVRRSIKSFSSLAVRANASLITKSRTDVILTSMLKRPASSVRLPATT